MLKCYSCCCRCCRGCTLRWGRGEGVRCTLLPHLLDIRGERDERRELLAPEEDADDDDDDEDEYVGDEEEREREREESANERVSD